MAETRPNVGLIVPTYGQFDYARKTVETALRAHPTTVAIVIDDASPDWDQAFWSFWTAREPRLVTARFAHNGGLTRSWNHGLWMCRAAGLEYAVCGNSDLLFPLNWFAPIEAHLRKFRHALVGPITNAPGHRPEQQVGRYLPGYFVSDKQKDVDIVGRKVLSVSDRYKVGKLNGFCMAARTDAWWAHAYDAEHVFNPGKKFRMVRNEDELQGRWKPHHTHILCSTYVFHYRGVSRKNHAGRRIEAGKFRPKKGLLR